MQTMHALDIINRDISKGPHNSKDQEGINCSNSHSYYISTPPVRKFNGRSIHHLYTTLVWCYTSQVIYTACIALKFCNFVIFAVFANATPSAKINQRKFPMPMSLSARPYWTGTTKFIKKTL